MEGDPAACRALFERLAAGLTIEPPVPRGCVDAVGRCALSKAAAAEATPEATLDALAASGYAPDSRDAHGLSPLSHACWKGRADAVRWLLRRRGADARAPRADAVDVFGVAPVHKAAAFGHPSVLALLHDARGGYSSRFRANPNQTRHLSVCDVSQLLLVSGDDAQSLRATSSLGPHSCCCYNCPSYVVVMPKH